MTDLLYRWPESARFGRPVTKTKLYEQGRVSSTVKQKLVAQVEEITWAYKLAESTINLPPSGEVPEIQVLVVRAKEADVDDVVLSTIDRAIKQPVIFEILSTQGTRMTAALKVGTPGGRYYSSEWNPGDSRQPLPPSINLPNLFSALLGPMLPTAVRPGEALSGLSDRLADIARVERDISALTRKLRAEPQLNRKVEMRRALKALQARLLNLTIATTAPTTTKTN